LGAAADGKLDEALSKMKKPAETPETVAAPAPDTEAAPAPPNTDELRLQAKQTLLGAAADGKLDEALSKMKKPADAPESVVAPVPDTEAAPAPPDTDQLRLQAKQTLLGAAADGKLDEALSKMKKPADASADAPADAPVAAQPDDSEQLRLQAKQTLLEATTSGKLDEAFSKIKLPTTPMAAEAAPEARKSISKEVRLQDDTQTSAEVTLPRPTESAPASPSKAMASSHLEKGMTMLIQESVHEELEEAMNKTVSKVMDGIKQELAKRDAQSQEMCDNVAELTKAVAAIQAKVL
jgi:hypothetical protein